MANRKNRQAVVLGAICLASFAHLAHAKARQITRAEAERLVTIQTKADNGGGLKGVVGIEDEPTDDKNYFAFGVEHHQPGFLVHTEFFAVDRRTGDVWGNVNCHEYRSRPLAEAQAALRQKLGMDAATYEHLRTPGPYCYDGFPEPEGTPAGRGRAPR